MVSTRITAKMPRIIIDKNPKLLAGTLQVSSFHGKADPAMRIRNASAAYVLDIIAAGLCPFSRRFIHLL